MSPVKSTKYIPSKVKNKPVINNSFASYYKACIGCTHKPYLPQKFYFLIVYLKILS